MPFPLDDPLFPARDWADADARARAEATPLGGTAKKNNVRGTVAALEHWVRGGSFHRYGLTTLEVLRAEGVEIKDAIEQSRMCPCRLDLQGDLRSGGRGMYWSASYQRVGVPDANGFNAGYSTVEDAAYQALHLIEEQEREAWVEALVVGVA